MCQEFCSQGGVPGSGGDVCTWGVCSQGECLVETPPDSYCCGQYTSYWNAFLLVQFFVCNPHRILLKEPKNRLLLPQNKVCEGYVFTGVCLSTGGGVSAPLHAEIHPPGQTPLEADTHCAVHAGIWSISGRYANHWNAFLFRAFIWPGNSVKFGS